jgi:uncharacterized protein (TIGR02246 family)
MRLSILSGLWLPILLFFLACEPDSEDLTTKPLPDVNVGPEADLKAIASTGQRLLEAAKAEDIDALLACFTDDVVLIPMGHPVVKGKPAIRVFYKSMFEEYDLEDIGPSLDEVVVMGEWAFSRETTSIVAVHKNHDDKLKVFNRGIAIWKRDTDGEWKLARAIGNR